MNDLPPFDEVVEQLDRAIEADQFFQELESVIKGGPELAAERKKRMIQYAAAAEARDIIDRFWAGEIPVALPVFLYFTKHDQYRRSVWRRAKVKVMMTHDQKSAITLISAAARSKKLHPPSAG